MAAGYSFPLLVKFEGNLNASKLKNKFVKYFQSKKANGGDCVFELLNGKEPVVRFKTEETRQKVLQKEVHEISTDAGVLKLTLCLPPCEGTSAQETPSSTNSDLATSIKTLPDEDGKKSPAENAVEEQCQSTAIVLGNVLEDMNREFLEMLVEEILDTNAEFSLEMLGDSAVVSFQSEKETSHFLSKYTNNRMLKRKNLSVKPLEVTAKITVENVPQHYDEDYLSLYFEKYGVVENIIIKREEQSALITFQDPKDAQRALKEKLKDPMKSFLYYESLGTALYGKDRPSLKLPPAFNENIDQLIWKYLCDNQKAADTIHNDLAKHFCEVDLQQPSVKLSPLPSLLQQQGITAKDIQQWKDTVKTVFNQGLSKYTSSELQVQITAWEESEEEMSKIIVGKAVVLVPDKDRGVISVVGLHDDVNKLTQQLNEILDQVTSNLERKRTSISEVFPLSSSTYQLLKQDGIEDNILKEFPKLMMTHRSDCQNMILHGLSEEVWGAFKKLTTQTLSVKKKIIELDNHVFEFLHSEGHEKFTKYLQTFHSVNAALDLDGSRVELQALSEATLNLAEELINRCLVSQCINVQDLNILKTAEWQDLVAKLESSKNNPSKKIMVKTSGQHVVVCGYSDTVHLVQKELEEYLRQNGPIEDTIHVKSETIIRFIQEHCKDLLANEVNVSFQNETICLSGSRMHVKNSKHLLENVISSIYFDTLTISKIGAKKFFQDSKAMYVSTVQSHTGCVVKLMNDDNEADNILLARGAKCKYRHQTTNGVEIVVCEANLYEYAAEAVINSANEYLKLNVGLAEALLKAAGPQLQDECDQLIKNKGKLRPGDCVLTTAGGGLCCRYIIHAVGPSYDPANPLKSVEQLRRAVRGSLDLAETNNYLSVALPAISSGNQGFPLKLCAETIAKSIRDFCDDKFGGKTLKKIHLVSNDVKTIQAMEAAMRQEFGSHTTTNLDRDRTAISSKIQHGHWVEHSSGSMTAHTVEGLTINLTKGNIQDSVTEGMVNTVGLDLDLNIGAVSKAIVTAAGPKLQDLIKEHKGGGNAKMGAVIITDGCELQSKVVFHSIAPHWNQGRDTVEKMLSEITKKCLSEAEEKGLSSLAFPAIGTGNLGYPKDLVASLMLKYVIRFSSKNHPKHLKEVIFILHPSDPVTIQSFTDELKKLFAPLYPKSGSTGATSQQQTKRTISKVTSPKSGMFEINIEGVTVQAVTGDITKETTDVIVNFSNKDFTHERGVSKAILDAAGPDVKLDCQQRWFEPHEGLIMTKPGNLKSRQIIHIVAQDGNNPMNTKEVFESVQAAIEMSAGNLLTSVSFPAPDLGNVKFNQMADLMLDAVVAVVRKKSHHKLNLVRIVLFQPEMLKEFHSSMLKKEGMNIKEKDGFFKGFFKNLAAALSVTNADDMSTEDEVFDKDIDPACFHICSDSKAKVQKAKQWISELIEKHQVCQTITDKAILSLSKLNRQRILEIRATMDVNVVLTYKSEKEPILSIKGLKEDVLKATTEIQEMLLMVRDEEASKFFPKHWDVMPANTPCHSCLLNSSSQEYKDVCGLFQATCKGNVLKIERIQNPGLWKSLEIKKQDMELRNGHQNNEKKLFHGACHTTITHINEHGFNRSYAGKNAAIHGDGTYFAIKANYSADDTYSKPDPQGHKFVYLCRVLVGEFTNGAKGMNVPPLKSPSTIDHFDSVTDNPTGPSMFIIFHDSQAYPEYLITFKKVVLDMQ